MGDWLAELKAGDAVIVVTDYGRNLWPGEVQKRDKVKIVVGWRGGAYVQAYTATSGAERGGVGFSRSSIREATPDVLARAREMERRFKANERIRAAQAAGWKGVSTDALARAAELLTPAPSPSAVSDSTPERGGNE